MAIDNGSASRQGADGAPEPTHDPHDGSDQDQGQTEQVDLNSDDDSEDDQYLLTQNAPRTQKISEKKRNDIAGFQTWLADSQRDESTPKKEKSSSRRVSVADKLLDIDSAKIIDAPREYQIDLFERAKQKNIIVVLDTGSGKTLIAVLLLNYMLEAEINGRAVEAPAPALSHAPKTAFFIVEKVAPCMQQYRVLRNNLGHSVGIVHGDIQGMTNRRDFWQHQLKNNTVIVATAQVLLDGLNNGFINMRQTSLLVFDEAHHAKKNHPYAKIIKSHYLREADAAQRPKILGMTASPVDAQTRDMRAAAAELESMMCSEIATVSDDVLRDAPRAFETYEQYTRLPPKEESRTSLWQQINALLAASESPSLRTALDFTEEASSTLGLWGADKFWSLLMTDLEVTKLVAKTEGELGNQKVESINQAIGAIHDVHKLVQESEKEQQQGVATPKHFSAKFKLLWEILTYQFKRGTSRCIIFVEKRYTALLLSEMLQHDEVNIPGVVPAHMVGSQTASSKSSAIATMTFREQVDVLYDFKIGNVNCLFSTTVAEEGIDIPACDLVIRWDMYNSMIQYIQSRGRARQKDSRFISLIENGNIAHRRLLKQAMNDSTALRQFCSALPEDRKVQDHVDAAAMVRAEEAGQKSLDIPATGARITYQNCLDVLCRFVSSLQGPSDSNFTPKFGVMPMGSQFFIAHVILPEVSPVTYVSGHRQRAKQMARRSAAYEACVMLYEKKYIDDHLQSTLARRLPAMRNARLAISPQKKAEYTMRIKPEIWSKTGPIDMLYATVLILEKPKAVGRPISPVALLTREPLPALPDIQLYFGTGHSSIAKPVSGDQPIDVGEGKKLEHIHSFTLKIFDDIFSKQYDAAASDMPYFLAPVLDAYKPGVRLDWETILGSQVDSYLDWADQPEDFYRDKLIIDPFDGSRKMITFGVNPNLRPSDPPPANAPPPKSRAYRSVQPTIKEYSNSYFLNRRKTMAKEWREDQLVINAELMSLRRNFLDQFFVDDASNNTCAIILQPLKVSPIPIGVVNMANLLPAIIYRLDQALIALEACKLVGFSKIRPELALEACTKDSDNSEEHDQERVNFQHGMGNNYERLEFLGDSFLKMATTISLFTIMPSMKEFESHTARMLQIANQNLFNHAVDRKLQEYVRTKSFDRRLWYPNLPLKKGKAPKTEASHNLADKSIADVCEALIGAAYLSDDGMDLAVRAVTKMVKNSNHKMNTWKAYYAAYEAPEWTTGDVTEVLRVAVASIRDKVGYTFQTPALLRSACKHPSYTYDPTPDYQRLEFLGDALLDMVVVDYLFRKFPLADPQWLTEHKMAIVSNQFLGCLCVKLGLHSHILLITSSLLNQRAEFATNLERAEAAATDDDGNVRSDYWRDATQPPKALADVIEALIGAMFVDSKYNYAVVEEFFTRHILPYFENMALYDSFADKHPVTSLARRLHGFGCQDWRLLSAEVPRSVDKGVQAITQSDVVCALLVHGRHFEDATAQSVRYAKVACAKQANEKLDGLSREDFQRQAACDCGQGKGETGQDEGRAGFVV